MKFWTLAGLLAGLVAVGMAAQKHLQRRVIAVSTPDSRYAIDELLCDQDL